MIAETQLQQTLSQRRFAITCEFTPPRGIEVGDYLEIADRLKGKVDAVNVNDNPNSNVRMSSLVFSKLLLERGLKPGLDGACGIKRGSPCGATVGGPLPWESKTCSA